VPRLSCWISNSWNSIRQRCCRWNANQVVGPTLQLKRLLRATITDQQKKDQPRRKRHELRASSTTPLTAALLLLTSVATGTDASAGAPQGRWGVGISAGPSLNFSSVAGDITRTGFGLTGSLTLAELLDVELVVGGRFAEVASHLDLAAGAELRRAWGRLELVAGPRVGVTVMKVHWVGTRQLWTWALLVNLGAGLRVRLWRGLEARIRLASFTLYYNEVGILCWEPSLGAGFRF
jgi:hypothetical protein